MTSHRSVQVYITSSRCPIWAGRSWVSVSTRDITFGSFRASPWFVSPSEPYQISHENISHRAVAICFFVLCVQPVQVNLSHMLCAAVLDPFEGQNYRIWAITHQAILCPILCKLFCYAADFFLTKFPPTRVKSTLECAIPKKNCTYEQNEKLHEDSNTSGNGHTHFD